MSSKGVPPPNGGNYVLGVAPPNGAATLYKPTGLRPNHSIIAS